MWWLGRLEATLERSQYFVEVDQSATEIENLLTAVY